MAASSASIRQRPPVAWDAAVLVGQEAPGWAQQPVAPMGQHAWAWAHQVQLAPGRTRSRARQVKSATMRGANLAQDGKKRFHGTGPWCARVYHAAVGRLGPAQGAPNIAGVVCSASGRNPH